MGNQGYLKYRANKANNNKQKVWDNFFDSWSRSGMKPTQNVQDFVLIVFPALVTHFIVFLMNYSSYFCVFFLIVKNLFGEI